jgi:DNA topoisomerase-3
MVNLITYNVKNDRVSQRVTITPEEETKKPKGKSAKAASGTKSADKPAADGEAPKKKRAPRKKAETQSAEAAAVPSSSAQPAPATAPAAGETAPKKYTLATLPTVCPLCGRGRLLRGRTAYGCSEYASGCTFRIPLTDVAEG